MINYSTERPGDEAMCVATAIISLMTTSAVEAPYFNKKSLAKGWNETSQGMDFLDQCNDVFI